jgi:hypothetical protein
VPAAVKKSLELWIGCAAGALAEEEYASKLSAAGFIEISVEPTRFYRIEEAREFLTSAGVNVSALDSEIDEKFRSAFVRAIKPLKG